MIAVIDPPYPNNIIRILESGNVWRTESSIATFKPFIFRVQATGAFPPDKILLPFRSIFPHADALQARYRSSGILVMMSLFKVLLIAYSFRALCVSYMAYKLTGC